MKSLSVVSCAFILAACASTAVPEGLYEATAVDTSGKALSSIKVITNTSTAIYSARNALCINYPKARIATRAPGGAPFGEDYPCP